MPIGEAIKSGGSFSGLAEYILAQGVYKKDNKVKKPEIVFRNHVYSSKYLELGNEFREVAKENTRVTKPVMHLVVNFATSDNVSIDNQKEFVLKILQEMGVKENNHQFMVVKHNDKHPHYHIQINRIGFDGKTLSDSNTKLRIGTACDKIEKEMGLDNYLHTTRAFVYDKETKTHKKNKNRKLNKSLTVVKASRNRQVGIQKKKDFIQIEALKALDNHKVDSLELLKEELSKRKISFKYTINKKEQVGTSFEYGGLAVKGSKISLKGSLIKNQLLASQKFNKELKNKEEFLSLIVSVEPLIIKSVEQIRKQYNLGKIPELPSVFKENEILYKDDGSLSYKDLTLEAGFINTIVEGFNKKLEEAKIKQQIKLKEYEKLQKTEFKKSFLGFLNAEQKMFNKDLKDKLLQTKLPLLDVNINRIDCRNEVIRNIHEVYHNVKGEKLIKDLYFSVDKSLDLDKKEVPEVKVKKEITLNLLKKELEKNNLVPKNNNNENSELEVTEEVVKRVKKISM